MKTFLENLTKELKKNQLSDEDIREIIQDHEQMIKEAIDDGLNEDDLNEKFGNPEDLAKDLAETLAAENSGDETTEDDDTSNDEPYEFNQDEVNALLIKVIDEDIDIELSDTDNYQVFCINGKKKDYDVSLKGGVLHIERKHSSSIKFRIIRSSQACHFKVLVPQGHHLEDVKILSKSSDIDVEHLTTKSLTLENLSGDVDLEHLNAGSFRLKTVSGDADIEHCQFNDIDMSLVSGDIDLEHVEIKETFKISTVSGDVEVEHSTCKDLIYNAVSGDLDGHEFYPETVRLKSVSGDISFENDDKDRKIEIISKKSLSGDINL